VIRISGSGHTFRAWQVHWSLKRAVCLVNINSLTSGKNLASARFSCSVYLAPRWRASERVAAVPWSGQKAHSRGVHRRRRPCRAMPRSPAEATQQPQPMQRNVHGHAFRGWHRHVQGQRQASPSRTVVRRNNAVAQNCRTQKHSLRRAAPLLLLAAWLGVCSAKGTVCSVQPSVCSGTYSSPYLCAAAAPPHRSEVAPFTRLCPLAGILTRFTAPWKTAS
jgi:hypothetical protein